MAKITDFTDFANERPNYFPGQYLLEDDFELQHKYLSDRQRYHNQSLHISGIIEGLEVVVIQNSKSVQIKSGSAIDSEGNLILLKEDTTFTEFTNKTGGELYIQYSQDKHNQQQKDVTDSYTRWMEKPIIKFDTQTPQNCIKLAKLTIKDNIITLDANLREYSGLSLPNANSKALTLRSGGDANPNLAVLTGSLKIDGDLTVSGTISGTIDTKNINSGILSVDRIPNLSSDKINSGILSIDRIPNLSADKITSGTLSVDRIPNLSADKITSGTIAGNLTVNGAVKLGYASDISDFGSPLMSGFYQNVRPANAEYILPDKLHNWTHLITARHSNTNNNNQLQIAASYQSNDRIFFRKIASSGTANPTWNEIATRGANVFNGAQTINGSVQLGGFTDADNDEWPQITWYRELSKNWDEGLLKHSSARGVFKKAGYGVHFHRSREFGLWSSDWDALFAVEGQTGNTYIKGALLGNAGTSNGAVLREMYGNARIAFDYTGSIEIYSDQGTGGNFVKVKTFVIDHPIEPSKYLIHGTLEGPEASVYYRGSSQLVNGRAEIVLPNYFESLTQLEGRTIILTNINGFDNLMVQKIGQFKINHGKFYVVSDNPESCQEFDWEVKAIRKDVSVLDVEPNKNHYKVKNYGPYTYAIANN